MCITFTMGPFWKREILVLAEPETVTAFLAGGVVAWFHEFVLYVAKQSKTYVLRDCNNAFVSMYELRGFLD
jgi:hypothetical protein